MQKTCSVVAAFAAGVYRLKTSVSQGGIIANSEACSLACIKNFAHAGRVLAFCGVSLLASLSVFAEDLVLTQESGSSDSGLSIGNEYSRIVKQGAGEVRLTVAASGFNGEVVVEEGTLTISNKDAVGTGMPITVVSGATLHLNFAGAGQAELTFDHVVTIAGDGVGGTGALRYSSGGETPYGAESDSLLPRLVLSANATIDASNRWGISGSTAEIDLGGYTLTRIGGYNDSPWVVNSHVTAGNILNKVGMLTLENTPRFDSGTTITLADKGGQMNIVNLTESACLS